MRRHATSFLRPGRLEPIRRQAKEARIITDELPSVRRTTGEGRQMQGSSEAFRGLEVVS